MSPFTAFKVRQRVLLKGGFASLPGSSLLKCGSREMKRMSMKDGYSRGWNGRIKTNLSSFRWKPESQLGPQHCFGMWKLAWARLSVANLQLTNLVFLLEYDCVFFVVVKYNCFLQTASNTKNPLRQHCFQLRKSSGTLYFLVGFQVFQLFSETWSLN